MTDYLDRRVDFADPRLASAFDEVSLWGSRFGRMLLERMELRRGVTGLDLGCGTGFPLFELAHAHGASSRFVGADPWLTALEGRAKAKRDAHALPNVALAGADGARLPFRDGAFDLIVSNLGINNFDDPGAVLRECARVARPGARLVLTSNLSGHMGELYAVFREVVGALGRSDYLDRLDANEAHRGSAERWSVLVEESGFRVTRMERDTFVMRYLDGSALLRHPLTVNGFLGGWRSVVDPEDEQGVFAELERRLNRIAEDAGELRMTVPMLYLEAIA
jgi:arsenite methyltransferase